MQRRWKGCWQPSPRSQHLKWYHISREASPARNKADTHGNAVVLPSFPRQANIALTAQALRHKGESLNLIDFGSVPELEWNFTSLEKNPMAIEQWIWLMPGCSSGLYGSHVNNCKTVLKPQGTGNCGWLSPCCRKPGWHLSLKQGMAGVEAEKPPMPEWKERDFGEAPARNSSCRPSLQPHCVSGAGGEPAVRVLGSCMQHPLPKEQHLLPWSTCNLEKS